jgi:MSHA biogenesis protein MshI
LEVKEAQQPVIMDYVNYRVDQYESADALQEKVKQYIEEQSLKKAYCCLVLDDQDYQLLAVEPPKVPASEMAEAVKWKVKDLIQFPITEAVVDVFSQPESHDANREIIDVVVANKSIIDTKAQFIQDIGLDLVAIDIPELAYRNYFETCEHSDANVALVLVKQSYGKLVVINKGNVCFSRSFFVNYGGGLFDDIPENEIVLELQRSLDYYERQMRQVMPTTVVFAGDNLVEDKISRITRESFNQTVTVENVKGFDFSEEDSLASSRLMATYGASLRHGLVSGAAVGDAS